MKKYILLIIQFAIMGVIIFDFCTRPKPFRLHGTETILTRDVINDIFCLGWQKGARAIAASDSAIRATSKENRHEWTRIMIAIDSVWFSKNTEFLYRNSWDVQR